MSAEASGARQAKDIPLSPETISRRDVIRSGAKKAFNIAVAAATIPGAVGIYNLNRSISEDNAVRDINAAQERERRTPAAIGETDAARSRAISKFGENFEQDRGVRTEHGLWELGVSGVIYVAKYLQLKNRRLQGID